MLVRHKDSNDNSVFCIIPENPAEKVDEEFFLSVAIRLICFGYASDELEAVGIPVEALGYLDSDEKIMTAYCTADIFVLPSLEDNLPNTMLEAMSCGTPGGGL
jgi:glycosyltransferase involved in cell wall biosynthesis